MFTRIIIFVSTAIIAGFIFSILLDFDFPPFSYLLLVAILISLAGVVYELKNYKSIHFGDAEILVSYIFKPDKRFKASEIQEWQELRYYNRSSLKRALILFFSDKEKLTVNKDDFKKEFEDILTYLKLHLDHLDGSEARRVKVSKHIKLSSVQIYKAWTTQNLLCSWWSADEAVMTIKQFSLAAGGSWSYQLHSKGGRTSHDYQFLNVLPNEYISWLDLKSPGYRYSFKINSLSLQESRVSYETVFPTIEECEKLRLQYDTEMSVTLSRLEEELLRTNIKV